MMRLYQRTAIAAAAEKEGFHMLQKGYDILLRTPVGDKQGRMSVSAEQGRLEGKLEVLGHATCFSGEIDESGFCHVSGHLITALSTVPFIATGYIRAQQLKLTFRHHQELFEIVGDAR